MAFTARFQDDLSTPGLRIPLTADRKTVGKHMTTPALPCSLAMLCFAASCMATPVSPQSRARYHLAVTKSVLEFPAFFGKVQPTPFARSAVG